MTVALMRTVCAGVGPQAELVGQLAAELLDKCATVLLGAVGQMHIDHGGVDVLVTHQRLDGEDGRASFGKVGRKRMPQRINTLLTNSAW